MMFENEVKWMKNTIRMYNVFFPRKFWMWFTYILYPLVIILTSALFLRVSLLAGVFMSLMIGVSSIVAIEYILDIYMMFGMAAKDNKVLEYVKSSGRGVHLLQQALRVDGMRRMVTALLIMTGLYLTTWMAFAREIAKGTVYEVDGEIMSHPSVLIYFQCGVIAVLFVELGMMITRRVKNILINFVLVYLMSALACPFSMVVGEFASVFSVAFSVVLLVIVMVVSRKVLIEKVRENYYDEGYKELLQTT